LSPRSPGERAGMSKTPPRPPLFVIRVSVFVRHWSFRHSSLRRMSISTKTAPPPTAGGASLLTYRPYRGRLRGPMAAVWAIARTGLRTILRRKLFWGLYGCGLMIFLFFFFGQYLLRYLGTQLDETTITLSPTSRLRVKPAEVLAYFQTQLKVNGSGATYRNAIWYEGFVVMIVLALAGSVLVGNDFRFGSL